MAEYMDDSNCNNFGRSHSLFQPGRLRINSDDDIDSPLLLNEPCDQPGETSTLCPNLYGPTISSNESTRNAKQQLMYATVLCSLFMVTELVGGYMAGSLAIMSDAAHLLSDCVGFIVALLALWFSTKPPDKNMTFGYKRAEVLGATSSVLGIWLLTGILLYLAACRLWKGDYDIQADTMMIVSGIGVVFNIIMGLVLQGSCQQIAHLHSHIPNRTNSHLDDYFSNGIQVCDRQVAGQVDQHVNINIRAAVIHVLGDLIQSCGVFLAAIIIKFCPEAKIADPICTFFFSIIVLFTTMGVLRESLLVLMEGAPRCGSGPIQAALLNIPGVANVHCLNLWSLTVDVTMMSAHIVIDGSLNADVVLQMVSETVRNDFKINQSTIQVEKTGHLN